MKESNWQDCLDNQSARIVKPDIKRAKILDRDISLCRSF